MKQVCCVSYYKSFLYNLHPPITQTIAFIHLVNIFSYFPYIRGSLREGIFWTFSIFWITLFMVMISIGSDLVSSRRVYGVCFWTSGHFCKKMLWDIFKSLYMELLDIFKSLHIALTSYKQNLHTTCQSKTYWLTLYTNHNLLTNKRFHGGGTNKLWFSLMNCLIVNGKPKGSEC